MNEEKAECAKVNGDVLLIHDGLDKALMKLAQAPYIFEIESVFCIGGATVYSQAVKPPCVRTLRSVSYTRIFVNNNACTHFFHFPPKPEQATCHHINGTSKHICNYSIKKRSNKSQFQQDVNNITEGCECSKFEEMLEMSTDNKQK